MPRSISRYGWIPDLPDHRDQKFSALVPHKLPGSVDLRPGCCPVYDQGQLGCHDDKTEVLTEDGWKLWADCTPENMLGTMRPYDHKLELQLPEALYRYEYNGSMEYGRHQSLDFLVTPSHRMFVRRWNQSLHKLEPTYSFQRALALGWYCGLPASTTGFVGTELSTLKVGSRNYSGNDFLAMLALVISDGWVGGTESNWNTISFCCFRMDRLPFVQEFAYRMGFEQIPSRPNVWKWSDPELAEWLRRNIFASSSFDSRNKVIPQIVKIASQQQIEHFLKFYGDQHGKDTRQFYSASKRIIDDLQELVLRIGKRSGIYDRPPRDTIMSDGREIHADNCGRDYTLTEWGGDKLSCDRKANVETVNYKGMVYCATVPNGLLVTRRNGQILISGNSCTANALAAAYRFELGRQKLPDYQPSRLMIYYDERVVENTVNDDSGAMIRDGIKTMASLGACSETEWPYTESQFATKPSAFCYTEGLKHQVTGYFRLDNRNLNMLRTCLAQGLPFVFGFSVYDSFESDAVANTGVVPMPDFNTENQIGGHATLCVGYDDGSRMFLVQNSWGPDWGMKGFFIIPYDYLNSTDLADDFWSIRLVEG